jgi:hypothetical protein
METRRYGTAQMVGNVIGAYTYSLELSTIDQPSNASYVPYPNSSMSCDVLQQNIDLIDSYLALWKQRLLDATKTLFPSHTKINNIMSIIANLGGKRKRYSDMLVLCLQQQDNPPVVDPPPAGGDPSPVVIPDHSGGLVLLALGVVGIVIYKRSKRRGKR